MFTKELLDFEVKELNVKSYSNKLIAADMKKITVDWTGKITKLC